MEESDIKNSVLLWYKFQDSRDRLQFIIGHSEKDYR